MLHISQGGYLDSMREAALSIYQEYLSDKVNMIRWQNDKVNFQIAGNSTPLMISEQKA